MRIVLASLFKHFVMCTLCCYTCSLYYNSYMKDFDPCPVSLRPFLCLVFIYNWSDTRTCTVNWYRGSLHINLFSMVSVCSRFLVKAWYSASIVLLL